MIVFDLEAGLKGNFSSLNAWLGKVVRTMLFLYSFGPDKAVSFDSQHVAPHAET